jgi:plastocyanin
MISHLRTSMRRRHAPALLVVVLLTASCGGSDTSPTPSSPTPTPTPGAPSGATITITSSGVAPRSVTVAAGSRVTFVNNDSRSHEMASNPHPSHTDCTAINDVGFLAAGQSRQTGNLNTRRTCGYHDHNLENDTSLQGSITIQ